MIAFQQGTAPILAKRIKWYQDPAFKRIGGIGFNAALWWALLAAVVAVVVWAAGRRPM